MLHVEQLRLIVINTWGSRKSKLELKLFLPSRKLNPALGSCYMKLDPTTVLRPPSKNLGLHLHIQMKSTTQLSFDEKRAVWLSSCYKAFALNSGISVRLIADNRPASTFRITYSTACHRNLGESSGRSHVRKDMRQDRLSKTQSCY